MANDKNLISNSDRTPEERRENARKAGMASGAARRKKADLRKIAEGMMVGGIPEMMVKSLISIAADPANKNAVVAFKEVRDLLGQNTTLLDKKEQRARIASLRAKADQLNEEKDNGAIAKLDEVLKEIEGVI